jgi:hypothetical protein
MIFVAIFVTLAASITGGLVMFALKEKKILYFVAGGLDISAGKSSIVTETLHTSYTNKIQISLFPSGQGMGSIRQINVYKVSRLNRIHAKYGHTSMYTTQCKERAPRLLITRNNQRLGYQLK